MVNWFDFLQIDDSNNFYDESRWDSNHADKSAFIQYQEGLCSVTNRITHFFSSLH